jgi:hypothetical protein
MKRREAATPVERCLACEADGAGLRNSLNALHLRVAPICADLFSPAVGIRFRVHSCSFAVFFWFLSQLGKGVMEIWSVGVAKA